MPPKREIGAIAEHKATALAVLLASHRRQERRLQLAWGAIVALAGLCGVMALFVFLPQQAALDHNTQRAQTTAQNAQTTATTAQDATEANQRQTRTATRRANRALQANDDLIECLRTRRQQDCIRVVEGREGDPGKAGEALGPTDAQLERVLRGMCGGTCNGATGDQGEQGPGPTAEQLATAARAACEAGLCNTVTAEELAAMVAAQIGPAADTALQAYCQRDSRPCEVPRGPQGEKGDQGEPGTSFDCAGNPVPAGGTPATCPGQTVTETVTTPAPPPPATP